MTTVTILDTPSAQIIADANAIETIKAGNMMIGLKKPSVVTQYRIVEMLGASAKNDVYMGMIMPLLWVAEIDGEATHQPKTKLQLEALIQRLDETGIGALMEHLQSKAAPAEQEEAIKN